MLSSLLIAIGIVFMIVAIGICVKIIKINTIRALQWQWYVMVCFILFFLISYAAYLFLRTNYEHLAINSFLIVLILFLGAVFVVGVLLISYQMIHSLTRVASENIQANKRLIENTAALEQKQKELERSQEAVQVKNKELEKTLEEFYTLRMGLQKDIEAGTAGEENRKIKERLDKLKKL